MATPKSGIATGIADLKGVGMYTASPLLKTPGYGKIGGVPLNDDEAERRIRRRENHIRSAVSPGCHTPRSIVRNPDRARTLESGTSTFTNSQIAEHYAICVKLSTENKINAKNAFGLHLIDCMAEMLRKRGEMTNFQVAGCTLDASAKIYASRVDSIYNDAYKMLGGLGRSDKQDDKENINLEQNSQQGLKKKTKKSSDAVRVIEKNLKSLDVNTFDLEFEVDPLFKKTSATFDEGGVEGLLLNQLCVDSDSCCLLLDSSCKHSLIDKPIADCSVISKSDLKVHFKYVQSFQKLRICKTFADFIFNEANSHPVDFQSPPEIIPSHTDNCASADNSFTFANESECAPEINVNDDFPSQTEVFEELVDNEVYQNQMDNTVNPLQLNELGFSDTIQVTEYSYFNPTVISAWAGPHHWKLRPRVKDSNTEERGEVQKKKRPPRQVFRIDLLAVPSQNLFTKGRATTTMSNTVLKRMASSQTIIPHAPHVDVNALYRLFCKTKWRVKENKKLTTEIDFCDNNNIHNGNNMDYTFDDCPTDNIEEDLGGDDVGVLSTGNLFTSFLNDNVEDLVESNLVAEPKKITPITIDYAKQAKKIDVKKVKKVMWNSISSNQECQTSLSFSTLHSTTKCKLSSAMGSELSVPISFVCLLHLANEKCLSITPIEDMLDCCITF